MQKATPQWVIAAGLTVQATGYVLAHPGAVAEMRVWLGPDEQACRAKTEQDQSSARLTIEPCRPPVVRLPIVQPGRYWLRVRLTATDGRVLVDEVTSVVMRLPRTREQRFHIRGGAVGGVGVNADGTLHAT